MEGHCGDTGKRTHVRLATIQCLVPPQFGGLPLLVWSYRVKLELGRSAICQELFSVATRGFCGSFFQNKTYHQLYEPFFIGSCFFGETVMLWAKAALNRFGPTGSY